MILWDKKICINLELLEFGDAECTISDEKWNEAEEKARQSRGMGFSSVRPNTLFPATNRL